MHFNVINITCDKLHKANFKNLYITISSSYLVWNYILYASVVNSKRSGGGGVLGQTSYGDIFTKDKHFKQNEKEKGRFKHDLIKKHTR